MNMKTKLLPPIAFCSRNPLLSELYELVDLSELVSFVDDDNEFVNCAFWIVNSGMPIVILNYEYELCIVNCEYECEMLTIMYGL